MPFMRPHRSYLREARGAQAGAPRGLRGWAAGAVCLVLVAGCGPDDGASKAPAEQPLADDADKASYSMGYRFAANVAQQFPDEIHSEAFVRGVRDQLDGAEPAVDDAEAEKVLTAMMEARQAAAANDALKTLEDGLAFLEKNGKREEVTTLESGLQYEVLEEGEGDKPEPTDTVTTHYEGRLIDGTVFDSSYQRGEPASFPLNRVIAGWTEGLQLMSPGAKYRLFVPADLAYGEREAGSIPPNSTLIFDVELLDVQSPEQAAEGDDANG